ncbi:MAG: cation-transporting P-type ATPase, partial [Candidatus Omnitrophica bacterium]|nr:cation-transporting P-type ATPase [Candidatus Omnitrophota bacterium]
WVLIGKQLQNMFTSILVIAGIISLIFHAVTDASIIFLIVTLNIFIGFMQEFKAEKALKELQKFVSKTTIVKRDNNDQEVPVEEIVPGDILILREGMKVPADAKVIESKNLTLDESMLTGESFVKYKSLETLSDDMPIVEMANVVFMGTIVLSGSGKAIVFATGAHSEFGTIRQLTAGQVKELSPLQKELNTIAKRLSIFVLFVAAFVFIAGLLSGESLYKLFMYAVSISVACVPEGLPTTVTIALALGVKKLIKKNAIVKQLSSIETLGCTQVICTDKTGTLTQNQMTVRRIYADNIMLNVTGDGYSGTGEIQGQANPLHIKLIEAGALCNNSSKGKNNTYIGDPTDIAFDVLFKKAKIDGPSLKNRNVRILEKPFDADRKMITVGCRTSNGFVYYTKGNPSYILDQCSHIMLGDNKIPLTKALRDQIVKQNEEMSNNSLRVIACAYKDFHLKESQITVDMLEKEMVFIGLVGMMDPLREGVIEAVKDCKRAGIKLLMITGDQPATALAAAKKMGIVDQGKEVVVITGRELESLDDEKLSSMLDTISVIAQATPLQKNRIVNLFQKKNRVIAMTGDGVNDAPALKRADIGVAMGSGSDVSKEAADMILLDDSFATIVEAVRSGRGIYENIKKFVLYVFAGISTELIVVLGSIFSPIPVAITAVQILWIDLGVEVLPALALSMDPVNESVMDTPPRKRKDHILNWTMIISIIQMALWQGSTLLLLFFWSYSKYGLNKAQTYVFTTLILYQMFNVFNCRNFKESIFHSRKNSNKYLIGSVALSVAMQLCIIYFPLGNKLFGTIPLSIIDWIIILSVAVTIIPYIELIKLLKRKRIG